MSYGQPTCPACKGQDVAVGFPDGQAAKGPCSLAVPLRCKKCGHAWTVGEDPLPTLGERDDERARIEALW